MIFLKFPAGFSVSFTTAAPDATPDALIALVAQIVDAVLDPELCARPIEAAVRVDRHDDDSIALGDRHIVGDLGLDRFPERDRPAPGELGKAGLV